MNAGTLEALLLLVLGLSMVAARNRISWAAQKLATRVIGNGANIKMIGALSLVLILGLASALAILIVYLLN